MSTAQIKLKLGIAIAVSLLVHCFVVVWVLSLSSPALTDETPTSTFVINASLKRNALAKAKRRAQVRAVRQTNSTETITTSSLRAQRSNPRILSDPSIALATDQGLQSIEPNSAASAPSRQIVVPAYTLRARRKGIEGKVVLDVLVGEDGHVKRATIKQGLGYGLDELCIEAMMKSVFEVPLDSSGKPKEQRLVHTYRFQLLNPQ